MNNHEALLNKLATRNANNKSICILGGGLSGLSIAYYLLEIGRFTVVVLEKTADFGGNCRTFDVELDQKSGLKRWADMGVNDYNHSTYLKLNALMAATGYIEGNRLEDTESYGNENGSISYTNDGAFFTKMPDTIARDSERFKSEAHCDMEKPEYAYYTLQDYVTEKNYSPDYIYNNLYPRVNAMYFCAGAPAEMSFRGVMSYYKLQEGYGDTKLADRRYFKNGSSSWIASLRNKITEMGAILETDVDAMVLWNNDAGPQVIIDGIPNLFDDVVMAMPADEAIKAFGGSERTPADVLDVLVQFPYVTDMAVVHTDPRSLQPNINSWRTYNIHVFDSKDYSYGPYTINYVANRHQNDPENSQYNKNCENPQFFVSLNPMVMPAENSILPRCNNAGPAQTTFRHQKLSVNTIRAQEKMQKLQGKYHLWYANGYIIGAGLHEECLTNSSCLAATIAGLPQMEQVYYATPEANSKQYAPDYIVNAHKNELTSGLVKRKISESTSGATSKTTSVDQHKRQKQVPQEKKN